MEKFFMATVNAADKIGSQRTIKMSKVFGSAENFWKADGEEIEKSVLPPSAVKSFLDFREKHPDAPEKLAEFCKAKNFGLTCISDEDYPPILREISSPPAVLYYRGKIETFAERIAIVGTRDYTDYGKTVASNLGEELATAGLTVVSGAAMGIDIFAHRGALKFGRTVAVLGSGINWAFNHGGRKLFEEISERGVVLSEFNPNFRPNAGTFPSRNRIIAGLSRGVIVVEAGKKSGALITANFAGDFGRDVFAVPGNISLPKSIGCNELIRDGAILITSAQDVLDQYNFELKKVSSNDEKILTQEPVKLDGVEKKIFDIIPADEYITLDEILMQIDDIDASEISSMMIELELKNCIVEDSGRYIRK